MKLILQSRTNTIKSLLLGILLLVGLFSYPLQAQPNDTDPEVRKALITIAKYTQGNIDYLTFKLEEIGYNHLNELKKFGWENFPAIRKIEIAYAEVNNGAKFLSMLASNMAIDYGAMNEEPALKKYINVDRAQEPLRFKPLDNIDPDKINVEPEVRKAIYAIAKSIPEERLGEVLQKWEHDWITSYEIQRRSTSYTHALEWGISNAKVPPSQMERIKMIPIYFPNKYEGLRMATDLIMIVIDDKIKKIGSNISDLEEKISQNTQAIPEVVEKYNKAQKKLKSLLDNYEAQIKYEVQEKVIDNNEGNKKIKQIMITKRQHCGLLASEPSNLPIQDRSGEIVLLLNEVEEYLDIVGKIEYDAAPPKPKGPGKKVTQEIIAIGSEDVDKGGPIKSDILESYERKDPEPYLSNGSPQDIKNGDENSLDGGIHFVSQATLKTNHKLDQHILAYDDSKQNIILMGLSAEDTYIFGPVEPEELKALYKYAVSSNTSAISIENLKNFSFQGIFLNSQFVDTKVGQYLFYTDIIPWDFDSMTYLPNTRPNPLEQVQKAAYRYQDLFFPIFSEDELIYFTSEGIQYPDIEMPFEVSPLYVGMILILQSESLAEFQDRFYSFYNIDSVGGITELEKPLISSRSSLGFNTYLKNLRFVNLLSKQTTSLKWKEEILSELLYKLTYDYGFCHKFHGELSYVFGKKLGNEKLNLYRFKQLSITNLSSSLRANRYDYSLHPNKLNILAVLYDDDSSFELKNGFIDIQIGMQWKYYTSKMFGWDKDEFIVLKSSKEQGNRMFEIQPQTDIMTQNINQFKEAYTPLNKVIEYAKIISFLRWAINAEQTGEILRIDFSSLGKYSAYDNARYRTPDVLDY